MIRALSFCRAKRQYRYRPVFALVDVQPAGLYDSDSIPFKPNESTPKGVLSFGGLEGDRTLEPHGCEPCALPRVSHPVEKRRTKTKERIEGRICFPLFNMQDKVSLQRFRSRKSNFKSLSDKRVFLSAQRCQGISCPAQSVQRDGLCAILVLSKKRDTIQGEQDAESTLQKLAVDRGCPPL